MIGNFISLPRMGKAAIREYPLLKRRRSRHLHSSFVIRAKLSFRVKGQHAPWAPYPLYLIPQNRSVFSFAHFVSTSSETPMYCESVLAT